MIERTEDVVIRVPGSDDDPVHQLTLEEFVESFYDDDSEYTPQEADAIYEGLRLLAPNGEFYMAADGLVAIRFHELNTKPVGEE